MTYILFQMSRTPSAGQDIVDAANDLFRFMAAHDPKLGPHADAVRVTMTHPIEQAMAHAVSNWQLVMDLRCKLLINNTSVPFITSDDPVVLYNQLNESRNADGGGIGLACKGLQIFLPLSPTVSLIVFDADVYRVGGRSSSGIQVPVSAEDVDSLNGLQILNCAEQVFFNLSMKEDAVRRAVDKFNPLRQSKRRTEVTPLLKHPSGKNAKMFRNGRQPHRIRLRLSKVSELPSMRDFRFERLVYHRDPGLVQLMKEFDRRVMAGEYRLSEFSTFLDQKAKLEGIE